MILWFKGLSPVMQALIAGLFTWLLTAAGSLIVVFVKKFNRKLLDTMLGFSAGVMIAASYWSLLAPAIAMSEDMSVPLWFPAVTGFLMGAGFLFVLDRTVPHLHPFLPDNMREGIKTHWRSTVLLVLAITIHNIPEGLAVGVAFGSAGISPAMTIASAIALAIGIGIQNVPEGIAVAMPIRGKGVSRSKSFFYGQLSALVEPVFAVIGAFTVMFMRPVLPYALAFAAGAMIFVTVEEVIPESQQFGNNDHATIGAIAGFAIMMLLDVALG